jgi:hypothetical protein
MLIQIDFYILGYQNAAFDQLRAGIRDPSANVYDATTYNQVSEDIRHYMTRPVHNPLAHIFGGGTDPFTCKVAVDAEAGPSKVCLDHITKLHEDLHAATCEQNKSGLLNPIIITRCISTGRCWAYQDNMRFSDVFFNEVDAYKLQKEAALAQLEIAKQDLADPTRQLTCELLLKAQDPNYFFNLRDLMGATFKWLLP